jgi:D-arabinose 1-dehydrogenase-like Zn-dependent alcohol dehydrogenase
MRYKRPKMIINRLNRLNQGTKMGDMADLEWGLSLVRDGKVKLTLDRSFRLDQAAEAHEYIAAGNIRGNIVLVP